MNNEFRYYRVGLKLKRMDWEISKNKRIEESKQNPASNDEKNRQEIVKMMWENINAGKTINEAIEIAMQSDLAKEFNYLTKNGLNIRQCFRNWLKGQIRGEKRRAKSKQKGERS